MNNQVNWMQQGWECPKCGAVMSPHTDCCVNCRGNRCGSTGSAIGNPLTMDEWIKQQSSPSSFCSSDSSELMAYGKEDPEVKNSGFQKKSYAVGAPNSVFDAAGGPPELNFDNSGYKEDPEEQWERYQLNV